MFERLGEELSLMSSKKYYGDIKMLVERIVEVENENDG